MVAIALIRPGSTEFDEQGRIKGCLDFPLSPLGRDQAQKCSEELTQHLAVGQVCKIDAIYCAPCESAKETAGIIAGVSKAKVRVVECFQNLNFGLWQGRTIDELRRLQPTVYRQFQANPLKFCPPGGESMESAAERIQSMLRKLIRKHRSGTVAIIVPDPLMSLVRHLISKAEIGDIWEAEQDRGGWEIISLNGTEPAMV